MQLWHLTPDAPRTPHRVNAGAWVTLTLGTWPIEPGQDVWATVRVHRPSGDTVESRVQAAWQRNSEGNTYWRAEIGPFADGEVVHYTIHGRSAANYVETSAPLFQVGPKLNVALLWHQHQPLYRDLGQANPRGSYTQPWVRLHAIRDYYAMAHLLLEHPTLHLTINLTPVLLSQILDYVVQGATDRALDLTLTPAEQLTSDERETILSTFFDAHWHNQIFPHPRYRELFTQRRDGQPFTTQDVRDLQMWFNLAWFAKEFRDGEVLLATGEAANVNGFVARERGFTVDDIDAMVQEQMKIDPFCGTIYVFRAKRADRVKLLWWDGTGVCLLSKRLEGSPFRWPRIEDGVIRLSAAQLSALLEGMDWARVHARDVVRPSATQ